MRRGAAVEVLNGFTRGWGRGFVVQEVIEDGHGRRFMLRRVGDTQALPTLFDESRIRLDDRANR